MEFRVLHLMVPQITIGRCLSSDSSMWVGESDQRFQALNFAKARLIHDSSSYGATASLVQVILGWEVSLAGNLHPMVRAITVRR